MDNIAIVWFRNDLRLHDNETLINAISKSKYVVPVYVFDERIFLGKTSFGFEKISNYRTQFLIESVINLRDNIRTKGGDLIIRIGKPEELVFDIAKKVQASYVYCNRERTSEEVKVQDKLESNLWTVGQELRYARGKMLYYTADLPFPIAQVPDVFTNYRKEIENIVPLRDPLPKPDLIPFPTLDIDRGEVPTLSTFGKKPFENKHIESQKFKGGESEAKKQIAYYLWESNLISSYKDTRNDLYGWDFSSKLSAWLSSGCVSPKYVLAEKNKYEREVKKNDSTYWLYFEMLWRDYFRLMGKKYGNKIFQLKGIRNIHPGGKNDPELFNKWAEGKTGVPFIDANMRQLNETGFMSNRGRQNVASFLVKDLKLNWIMGAEYFESLLIDYDPCSNYGNWNYVAGVGSDPREDRYFNILTQSRRYDPNGQFIKYWLPELSKIPAQHVHNPNKMSYSELLQYELKLGEDYPETVLECTSWV